MFCFLILCLCLHLLPILKGRHFGSLINLGLSLIGKLQVRIRSGWSYSFALKYTPHHPIPSSKTLFFRYFSLSVCRGAQSLGKMSRLICLSQPISNQWWVMLQNCGEERGNQDGSHENSSYLPRMPWTSKILYIKRAGRYGGLNIKVIFLLLKIKETM